MGLTVFYRMFSIFGLNVENIPWNPNGMDLNNVMLHIIGT